MQKQAEAIEYQGEKQKNKTTTTTKKKTIEEHEKELVDLINIFKKILISIETVHHIKNVLLDETAYEFDSIKNKINPNKLIHNFMTEERSPKDFRGYKICENNLKTQGRKY